MPKKKLVCCPNCGNRFSAKPQRNYKLAHRIVKHCSEYFNLAEGEIFTVTKTKDINAARQLAFYFIYNYCNYTYTAIGNMFGKNHATVMNGVERIEDSIDTQMDLYDAYTELKKQLLTRRESPLTVAA